MFHDFRSTRIYRDMTNWYCLHHWHLRTATYFVFSVTLQNCSSKRRKQILTKLRSAPFFPGTISKKKFWTVLNFHQFHSLIVLLIKLSLWHKWDAKQDRISIAMDHIVFDWIVFFNQHFKSLSNNFQKQEELKILY